MGRELAAASAVARRTFEEADAVLGFPLSRLCFDGPERDLTLTSNAQPAILAHSIAAQRAVADRLGDVALAAGHSLGEISAYVAAGALSFADGLRLVRRRGELMAASGAERPGTMAAVLGLDEDAVAALCERARAGGGTCVPANYNAPGQIVISGDEATVARAIALAREMGARRALALNVSGAFHSPLMASAEVGLREHLAGVTMAVPAFPVVSNVTAEPVRDPDTARDLLVRQLTSPVRWAESVRTMTRAGVSRFVELGPGRVLSGLLKRIEPTAGALSIDTAADVEAVGAPV